MKAIIIDDEINNIDNLKSLLILINKNIDITGTANNIEDAECLIRKQKPDVIFLDIEMPSGSGFDLLNKTRDLTFHCVFVTAYENYTLQAIKNHAFDYILKPIDIMELLACINKLEIAHSAEIQSAIRPSNDLLTIPTLNGFEIVDVKDVKYILSNGSCSEFIFKDQKKFTVSKNIGEVEKWLPEDLFFRIHNQHIVNLKEIKQYFKGRGGYVIMKDGSSHLVSSRNKPKFIEVLHKKG